MSETPDDEVLPGKPPKTFKARSQKLFKKPIKGTYAYFRHLRMIQLWCQGLSFREIGAELGYTGESTVRNFCYSPEGRLMRDEFMRTRDIVQDYLTVGELVGVKTLIELAHTAKNETVRKDAAIRLAEMAGQRGKPIERSESKSLSAMLSGEEARKAIQGALADPGVQSLLESTPALKQLLAGPLSTSGGNAADTPATRRP